MFFTRLCKCISIQVHGLCSNFTRDLWPDYSITTWISVSASSQSSLTFSCEVHISVLALPGVKVSWRRLDMFKRQDRQSWGSQNVIAAGLLLFERISTPPRTTPLVPRAPPSRRWPPLGSWPALCPSQTPQLLSGLLRRRARGPDTRPAHSKDSKP